MAENKRPHEKTETKQPGTDNSPKHGGYAHADTRMGHEHSKALADLEHTVTGSDKPPGREKDTDPDAMSRTAKSEPKE
jgi:hypothetical protein